MRFLVSGSSGFLGTQLREHLTGRGPEVVRLVRRPPGPGEVQWSPYDGSVDVSAVEAADVVVNLAGSATLGNPHSRKWARELRTSRVTHEWQQATLPAADAGARVCVMRTAVVQDRRSAPLKQQVLQFRAGAGGRLGPGTQYYPVVTVRDWVAAVSFLAVHDAASGPVNLCAPQPPTNAEFTAALAERLHRPAILHVPAAVLRLAAGPMAPEALGSVRAVPRVLLDAGFTFADPDIGAVLDTALAAG
jgi:NAD dependent epimerase/dehydratase family enzyme